MNDSRFHSENKVAKSLLKCPNCKSKIHALMIDFELELLGRPPPLFYLIDHSNSEDEIIKWITGEERKQDLVVSYQVLSGFENDIMIDLAFNAEMTSRTSALMIRVQFNFILHCVGINESILSEDHCCQKIMERDGRPKPQRTIASIISKS